MKKETLTKLFASALAVALCVPAVLTSPITTNAAASTVSGGQVVPGDDSTDTENPGDDSTDTENPGDDSVSGNKPGTDKPGTDEPGTDKPGTDEPGTDEPGTDEPGTDEPGTDEPGSSSTDESGSGDSGTDSTASGNSGSGTVTSSAITTSTAVVIGNSRVTSSIAGINTASAISATVVSTPVESLAAAIGLSESDRKAGTNIRSYICDNRDKASKAALQSAAEAAGKTVAGYVNMDLYTITKKGVVSKVTASTEPVTITFALPARLAKTNANFSVLAIDADGKAVIMDDVDTDSRTLTFNTKVFGAFTIVY